MQRIQKLELIGFKSFCDRTSVVFHEGITGIVGPNGCGKSNLADAISWVVGEQSPKSLRTDRMEGVIFSGTQSRKATSLAEVVISMSLAPGLRLPDGIEINSESFTIGRRLYRSGESEYSLDGRRCRLKDIQALLEGTGLGPNSYALIEQGRIGQILSSKPADRRSLIEEAARITLFKSRRYSAEAKLEAAQQNLLRVHDIIREVARQLNSLRRQAAKARRYKRMRDELRGVQRLKLAMEERQVRARLQDCSTRLTAAQEQERRILSDITQAESERQEVQDACRAGEEVVETSREALAELKLRASRAQGELQNQQALGNSLRERLSQLDHEQIAIGERGALIQKEQERLGKSAAALDEEIAQAQNTLDQEQSKTSLVEGAMRQTELEIDRLQSALLSGAGKLSDWKNTRARCQENLQRVAVRADLLEGERAGKMREKSSLQAELDALREAAAGRAAERESTCARRAELEMRAARLAGQIEQATAEQTALQQEYSLLQHRLSSLEEIERRRSNYSEGVQKYLATRLPGETNFSVQTLADQVETDPAYEAAIEDYLNDPLQFILVDRLEEAVSGVDRLRRIGAGKCTFMTIRNGHAHESAPQRAAVSGEGVLGYLDDLLSMKEEVRHAFERALPEYAATLMVSDLPTAFRVADSHPGTANFLTVGGEAYSPRGRLSAAAERKPMAGFLALKREKKELTSKIATLRRKLQGTQEQMAEFKKQQASAAEELRSVSASIHALELESISLGHKIAQFEGDIEKLKRTEHVAEGELDQLRSERTSYEARMQEAATGIEEIEKIARQGQEEARALSARLESLRTENSTLARNLAGLVSACAVKRERRSGVETDLRRLAAEAGEIKVRAEAAAAETITTAEKIAGVERNSQAAEAEIQSLAGRTQKAEALLAEHQKNLAARRQQMADFDQALRALHLERENIMGARGTIEIEQARLESDFQHLERFCQEEFHAALEQVCGEIQEEEWAREYPQVVAQHDELRGRIESFGAINMRALEEYQELDERYQFLTKQRSDIEQSIADTQKAIAEINRRSIEQFEDAFKNIRENFKEVFQILFKGGQCDLQLLDEGDVLESGIEIIAQPPGKKLQNVLLLSGGEKALTALALLIAIFRYRPSPFCVLDEVDAPLDDANITRFTELIAELSRETQFIIVTHNKRTMEIAQTLYGVTMEEPGVSKIVGVDFRPRQVALAS
jgi:chromosome segregation protein